MLIRIEVQHSTRKRQVQVYLSLPPLCTVRRVSSFLLLTYRRINFTLYTTKVLCLCTASLQYNGHVSVSTDPMCFAKNISPWPVRLRYLPLIHLMFLLCLLCFSVWFFMCSSSLLFSLLLLSSFSLVLLSVLF